MRVQCSEMQCAAHSLQIDSSYRASMAPGGGRDSFLLYFSSIALFLSVLVAGVLVWAALSPHCTHSRRSSSACTTELICLLVSGSHSTQCTRHI